ncbi:hypothetical protein GBA63_03160 [Rubrobacter tropicus]|uniref:Uncharacterized protein n=1 Tax=Rubrobacter tropicus TaxID=2653851 RepID=A0A6G8Q5J1_9ACTN|nr:hypothetical protein [Rubrobacter tropicus]QIN81745.1 hypothetical protein GBA63_03160 [Rubrobacter tropicus]
MEGHSKVEKALFSLAAFGALLAVSALALFALAGFGLASDLLRSAAGGVPGLIPVMLLTRSPRSGSASPRCCCWPPSLALSSSCSRK